MKQSGPMMRTLHTFFSLQFLLLVFYASADNPTWLCWNKRQVQRTLSIENRVHSGNYDEALTLIDQGIRKEKGTAMESALLIMKAEVYFLNGKARAAEALIKTSTANLSALKPEEQQAVGFQLLEYFELTHETVRAGDVLSGLTPGNPEGLNLKLFHMAYIQALQGQLAEALQSLNQVSYSDSTKGSEMSKLLQTKILLTKGLCFSELGQYAKSDSILSKSIRGVRDEWYYNSNRNFLLGKNQLQQHKYKEAASFFLKGIEPAEFNPHAFLYLQNMYRLIESHQRDHNTLNGNNYLRRLQQTALKSVGQNELAEVVYESAYGLTLLLQGEFSSAEYRLSRAEKTMVNEVNHPAYIRILELYKEIYSKTGKIRELTLVQEKLSQQALQRCGTDGLECHRRQLQSAMTASVFKGEYYSSLNIFRRNYSNGLNKQIGSSSPERLPYLYAFSEALINMDKPDSAVIRLDEALTIALKEYSSVSPEYLYAQARLCQGMMRAGKYSPAVELLNKLNASQEGIKIGSIAQQEKFYLLMAELNKVPGEFELSRKFLNKALGLQQKRTVPDFILQAETEEQYAFLYYETSNFYKAGKSLDKALKLKKLHLSAESPLLINTYQQLVMLNIATGDFVSADKYLTPLEKITISTFGNESVRNAEYKLLLAEYLTSIGDYKRALAEISAADKLTVQRLGRNHLIRAQILTDLASIAFHLQASENDVKLNYESALTVVENALGKNNPLYVQINTLYAQWLISVGKTDQASVCIDESEKFWKSKNGKDDAHLAKLLELRGDIANATNNLPAALEMYRNAADMYKDLFSDQHPDYTRSTGKAARVLFSQGKYQESLSYMDKIIPVYLEFTEHHFPLLSFRQKAAYWSTIRDEFEFYNNLAFNTSVSSPALWAKAWNNTLATKAILLSSGTKLLNQIYSSEDTVLIGYYNSWIAAKEQLISALTLSKKEQEDAGINRAELEAEIERLEKEMSTRSAVFAGDKKKQKPVQWQEIKSVLNENEICLELIRFRKYRNKFIDSCSYAGLQASKQSSEPTLVKIDNGLQLEKRYLKYYRNATTGKMNDEFSYDFYLKPFKQTIPEGKRVYVSSDGVYTQVNLEMLRLADGSYAIDHNDFVYVSNSKDLLNLAEKKDVKTKVKKAPDNYLVCGNPAFYSSAFEGKNKNISDLPGTEKEVAIIKTLLDSAGKSTTVLTEEALKEDTLKKHKSPRVLHIATHGFFMEPKESNRDELASNPLLNSGILLAEAGDILDNKQNPYVNQKDGVLTAFEAMDMQLDNTELVILSACETGRGEVEAGEGVYGLQRSFLMAGSKAVVVSLFKVNDEVTQKLMNTFYSNWLASGDKEKAFSDAKKAIKQTYKDPIYWGAFIMIEGKPARSVVTY